MQTNEKNMAVATWGGNNDHNAISDNASNYMSNINNDVNIDNNTNGKKVVMLPITNL